MLPPSVLQLNIWCNGQCIIQLSWGESQQLSAKLPYPTTAMQHYQAWQRLYLHVYPATTRGHILEAGNLTPSSFDPKQQLQEAEQTLLTGMHQWLGGEELLAIRQQIRSLIAEQCPPLSQPQPCPHRQGMRLLIACDHPQVTRLPWEAWQIVPAGIPPEQVRICRTTLTLGTIPRLSRTVVRTGKPRILAILAPASELNLTADRVALRSLAQRATLDLIQPTAQEDGTAFKQRLRTALTDDRGWDMLIFAGHSDETDLTGGKLHLATGVSLALSDIDPELRQAQQQGLQVAIFNSCNGLSLAQTLIQMGLHQVVVMRERIHDRVAQVFLTQLCQHLVAYQDVYTSVRAVSNHFKAEQIAYPSAALIPSVFCHPQARSFQFLRSRWQRLWQNWRPARWEIIALTSSICLSLLIPLQDLLLETRTLIEAFYRDQVYERFLPVPPAMPPVRIIAIDQDSINRALEQFDNFETFPMDRRYLAQIVNRLTQSKTQAVGIDYELYTQEPNNLILRQAFQKAIQQQRMWLVLAANRQESKQVLVKTASPNWSLMGDIRFFPWFVRWPKDPTCSQNCPFAYSLATAQRLSHRVDDNSPQPSLQDQRSLQTLVSQYLQQHPDSTNMPSKLPTAAGSTLIDFSLPPNRVYEWVPAWRFLQAGEPGPQLQKEQQQQVVIIASGGYEEAEDNFSVPMAMSYWCQNPQRHARKQPDCSKIFTGGEAHAYMTHHLLTQHHIKLIPDLWMLGLAALLGKWTLLFLRQRSPAQHRRLQLGLGCLPLLYGFGVAQLYISASVAIPWFWPANIYWLYIVNSRRPNNA